MKKLNTDGELTHEIIVVDGTKVDHYVYKQIVKFTKKKKKHGKR